MENEVSLEEYREARKVVELYEKQQKSKKLSIYDNCTKDDIIIFEGQHQRHGYKIVYLWVSKGVDIPDREADGYINFDTGFFSNSKSRTCFKTYDDAYKNLIKSFKRNKLIK